MRWQLQHDTAMWLDPGTWVALGVSALCIVVGFVVHHGIMRLLKKPSVDNPEPFKPVDKDGV